MNGIEKFVREWNSNNKQIKYYVDIPAGKSRPSQISLWFNPNRYGKDLTFDMECFRLCVDMRSQGVLTPVPKTDDFRNGVVEILVASSSVRYKEAGVIAALKYIGEEFLPKIEKRP